MYRDKIDFCPVILRIPEQKASLHSVLLYRWSSASPAPADMVKTVSRSKSCTSLFLFLSFNTNQDFQLPHLALTLYWMSSEVSRPHVTVCSWPLLQGPSFDLHQLCVFQTFSANIMDIIYVDTSWTDAAYWSERSNWPPSWMGLPLAPSAFISTKEGALCPTIIIITPQIFIQFSHGLVCYKRQRCRCDTGYCHTLEIPAFMLKYLHNAF